MAPRANWKGYLKLSLVSCAVALYPATSTSERIRFNIVNRKTGHRVRNQVVDAETGEPVDDEDRVKGYRVEGDQYVLLDDEDFDKVALETTHTIEIESFIPREEVDELYYDNSYYIVPDDKVAHEAFAVIRDAMKKKNVVGLARAVLYRRERLLMLIPRGKGIVATGLHYKNEVREEDTYFEDIPEIKIKPDMLDLAAHIVATKAGHFDPSQFEDRYDQALADLIKSKRSGKKITAPSAPRGGNVINLMDALRRSVKAERRPEPSRARRSTGAKKSTTRRRKLKRAS